MLSGEADLANRKGRHDLEFVARNERNETLRINFYWVDGIYTNGEFGCTHRGAFSQHFDSFPNISLSSDVIIINSGYWAGKRCLHPLSALRTHLPEYLSWAFSQASAAAASAVSQASAAAAAAASAVSQASAASAAASAGSQVSAESADFEHVYSASASREGASTDLPAALPAASLTASPPPSVPNLRGNPAAAVSSQSRVEGAGERTERLLRSNTSSSSSSSSTTTTSNSSSSTGKTASASRRDVRLIVRSAPPVSNGGDSCSIASRIYEGPATNLFLSTANRLIKHMADQINAGNSAAAGGADRVDNSVPRIEFFDSWQVEAPRFMDVCPRDHHYHCYGTNGRGKVVMRGDVGEAVVRSLIHYIEHGGKGRS
ncbi:hypothetical protein CLOM_g7560 [Closterium sp. NIES-68]|nr:hypothetical protein CLOM_g7560 [Closterium sp. NIES-68]